MARLVLLSEGYTGRTFDLKVEQTTVGRTSDNAIEIPDGSVSSHHGEFLLRGADVVFRDLGSTNGSFLANEKIAEVTLKHGQLLRLGQIEMRFESELPASKSSSKPPAHTAVIPGGVNREQLSTSGSGGAKTSEFKKKSNKSTLFFLIGIGVIAVILIAILAMLVLK
ncbi:MAG: FHA domain-containing protein [Verrucomicrobia bacterium]|nr:FHA domain-containing protein [Verrucomicrobiota bacterium]MBI3868079.1 FHA domain-containing protein [Verrucomicrobiota bacterium]